MTARKEAAAGEMSLVVSTSSALEDPPASSADRKDIKTTHLETQNMFGQSPGMLLEEYERDPVFLISKYNY